MIGTRAFSRCEDDFVVALHTTADNHARQKQNDQNTVQFRIYIVLAILRLAKADDIVSDVPPGAHRRYEQYENECHAHAVAIDQVRYVVWSLTSCCVFVLTIS